MEKKLSDTERLRLSKVRRIEEKRKANREKYHRNKDKINEARKRKRQLAKESKRLEQSHKEKQKVDSETKVRREKWKLAKQKQRAKQKSSSNSVATSDKAFSSRQAKRRKLTEIKSILPKTPTKRAAILKALIESPSTMNLLEDQGILTSGIRPEDSEEAAVAEATMRDTREALKRTKRKRSDDATQTSLCGKSVEKNKMKGKIAKRLNMSTCHNIKGI